MLSKSILHNRIGKWTLVLTEFALTFVSLKAIKGHVVTYFLANHSNVEILECYIGIKPRILYFDELKHIMGAGIGVVLIFPSDIPMKILFKIQLVCSNNEAKYEALIVGLETFLNLGAMHILIRGDSELFINQ